MSNLRWVSQTIKTLDLHLDVLNPRIRISKVASQEDIRAALLEEQEVLQLARGIAKWGSLFPGERIVTFVENGLHIVLEGNRRVCACQLLLNPKLIPPNFLSRFPRIADPSTIALLEVDVAPNRMEAEPYLTIRHTEPGVKPWKVLANINRFKRFIEDEGLDLKEIKEALGVSTAVLSKLAKEYHIMKYTTSLNCWDEKERDYLERNVDKLNPYLRFFDIKGSRQLLQIQPFTEANGYRFESTLPKDILDPQIEHIARAFIFSKTATTRTKAEEVLAPFLKKPTEVPTESSGKDHIVPDMRDKPSTEGKDEPGRDFKPFSNTRVTEAQTPPAQEKKNQLPQAAKKAKLFKPLVCQVKDNNLIQLTQELSRISKSYKDYPVATTMLFRALLESALSYQIKDKGLYHKLIDVMKSKKKGAKDPGLSDLIDFCIKNEATLFPGTRHGSILNAFKSGGYKDYADIIVHSKWVDADPIMLESMAKLFLKPIEYIIAPPA